MKYWPAFLEKVTRDRPNLGSFLSIAELVSCSSSVVDIRFPSNGGFPYKEITKKNNRDEITERLHKFCGAEVELRITLEKKKEDEKPVQNYIKPSATKTNINEEIENEPIIQTLMDVFDGELLG
ncbi:MAG: hypothetical protein ACLFQB_13820 [Chitinispirillaceae bacterium]